MPLSQKEVQHIAKLARLELTDDQETLYREQLSAILDYIAKLRELDTTDVPPTSGGGLPQMTLREDEVHPVCRRRSCLRTRRRPKKTNLRSLRCLNKT